jgi:hypothetical protein
LLSGEVGKGNSFSRYWNSLFNPDLAKIQFMQNAGGLGGSAGIATLDQSVGGGKFRPSSISTTGNLLDLGRSTGFISMADSPEVIRQKLSQLAFHVSQGQGEFGGRIAQVAREADDAIKLRRGLTNAGTLGALVTGAAIGGKKAYDAYTEDSAKLEAKAAAAKAREKALSKLSQRFFGATTQGFPGLTAAAAAGDRGLSGSELSLWDSDVGNLLEINRNRMFSKLDPNDSYNAGKAYQSLEEQYRDALRSMAMGQSDISEYPELAEQLSKLGSTYGIDYSKTPYYYGSKKTGAEGDEFESGLMLQVEDTQNPDGTTGRQYKRYGLKRGSNKLYDFAGMDASMSGE